MKKFVYVLILLAFNMSFSQKNLEKSHFKPLKQNLSSKVNKQTFGKCEAACFTPNVFNPKINTSTFQVSHGSPSNTSNGIWMWSYSNIGEGIFINYNFKRGKKYCIEADVILSKSGTREPINSGATFNFEAANTLSHNPVSSGGRAIANPIPREGIYSGNYASGGYPFNSSFTINKTYSPNNNYSQLWIYPRNPGRPHPQLEMTLTRLVIKEVIDCPCKIKAKIKTKYLRDCEQQFYANATTGSGNSIKGYLWNFGDGTTSTLQNPTHSYTSPGSYTVTLSVYGTDKKGNCCTETFKTKVYIKKECPQECSIKSNLFPLS